MFFRILTQEELNALTPQAIDFIYHNINAGLCSVDLIEKTLLHAVLISRFEHFKLDTEVVATLLERIIECGDSIIGGVDDEEWISSHGYC